MVVILLNFLLEIYTTNMIDSCFTVHRGNRLLNITLEDHPAPVTIIYTAPNLHLKHSQKPVAFQAHKKITQQDDKRVIKESIITNDLGPQCPLQQK